jgi:hypothetical protein
VARVEGTPEDNQRRPIVEVILRYAGRSTPIRALVDSGADYTTIPESLGMALTGLPADQVGQPRGMVAGMGAPTAVRQLDGVEVVYMGRVFAQSILVGQTPRVIVGRNDFMAVFDVRFYWGHHPPEFSIEPTQPSKGKGVASKNANPTLRPKKRR